MSGKRAVENRRHNRNGRKLHRLQRRLSGIAEREHALRSTIEDATRASRAAAEEMALRLEEFKAAHPLIDVVTRLEGLGFLRRLWWALGFVFRGLR